MANDQCAFNLAKYDYIPNGYNAIVPFLIVNDVETAMQWYIDVFEAKKRSLIKNNNGVLVYVEMVIADSMFSLRQADTLTAPGHPQFCIYVKDIETTILKALQRNGKMLRDPEDQYYGEKSGMIEDPFGITWVISSVTKNIPLREIHERIEGLEDFF